MTGKFQIPTLVESISPTLSASLQLPTKYYCPQLPPLSIFVANQNQAKHLDSRLNSVAAVLRVKPTGSIIEISQSRSSTLFDCCDEQLTFHRRITSVESSSKLLTSFCTGSIIFHLICFQHHRTDSTTVVLYSIIVILPKECL